ncbi:MAG: hypothetical protein MHMPM18_000442 [Marteilia pararefringens]
MPFLAQRKDFLHQNSFHSLAFEFKLSNRAAMIEGIANPNQSLPIGRDNEEQQQQQQRNFTKLEQQIEQFLRSTSAGATQATFGDNNNIDAVKSTGTKLLADIDSMLDSLKSASSDPSLSHDLRSINKRAAYLSRSISDIKKKMLGIGSSEQNQSQFNFGSAVVDFDNYDEKIMQNNIQIANEGVDHIYKANDLANVLQAKGRDTKVEVIEQGNIVDMIDKDLNDMHIDQQIAETKTMKIRCL